MHKPTIEYRTDPVGMDVARPRLSWKLPDGDARNVVQIAWRVRVATSLDRLAAPDVWDSGEVAGAQSVNVEYAGPPLEPSRAYFWTVETLDNHGRRAVSKPACWRTGLLRPENWAAHWITVNPQTLEEYDLKGAEWVAAGGEGESAALAQLSFEAERDELDDLRPRQKTAERVPRFVARHAGGDDVVVLAPEKPAPVAAQGLADKP